MASVNDCDCRVRPHAHVAGAGSPRGSFAALGVEHLGRGATAAHG